MSPSPSPSPPVGRSRSPRLSGASSSAATAKKQPRGPEDVTIAPQAPLSKDEVQKFSPVEFLTQQSLWGSYGKSVCDLISKPKEGLIQSLEAFADCDQEVSAKLPLKTGDLLDQLRALLSCLTQAGRVVASSLNRVKAFWGRVWG
eukprot:7275025-Pyramimonas_sp.AAC.1